MRRAEVEGRGATVSADGGSSGMGKDVEIAERLDLEGVPCPHNTARAATTLLMMDEGEVLELFVDDGEPIANVPDSLEFEGHTVLLKERVGSVWRLLVRRGEV